MMAAEVTETSTKISLTSILWPLCSLFGCFTILLSVYQSWLVAICGTKVLLRKVELAQCKAIRHQASNLIILYINTNVFASLYTGLIKCLRNKWIFLNNIFIILK